MNILENAIEITELYAIVRNAQGRSKFNIVSLDLNVKLNAFPACVIGLVNGVNIITGEPAIENDIIDIGSSVYVYMTYQNEVKTTYTKRVFAGIVASIEDAFVSAPTSIAARRMVTLASYTERADSIPLTAFYTSSELNNTLLSPAFLNPYGGLPVNAAAGQGYFTFKDVDFMKDPILTITNSIKQFCTNSRYYGALADDISKFVDVQEPQPMLLRPANNISDIIYRLLNKMLMQLSPYQAWIQLLTEYFYINVYPNMSFDATDDKLIRMTGKFQPAWRKVSAFDIGIGQCFDMRSNYGGNLSRIDRPNDVIAVNYYSPQEVPTGYYNVDNCAFYGGPDFQFKSYSDLLRKDPTGSLLRGDTNVPPRRLTHQHLPLWVIPGQAMSLGTSDSSIANQTATWALAIAKTFYATNNQAVRVATVGVPLTTFFTVATHLGEVITAPSVYITTSASEERTTMYGQLAGYTLSINYGPVNFAATARLTLAYVRTEVMNEKFGVDDADMIYKVQ